MVTAIAFGLAPMARTRAEDVEGLREGARAIGGRRERLRAAAELVPRLALAYAAGRFLQSLQTLPVGVTPADGVTFAGVVGLTLLMALAGTLLPTLRALRVDPTKAIRAE